MFFSDSDVLVATYPMVCNVHSELTSAQLSMRNNSVYLYIFDKFDYVLVEAAITHL